MIPYSRDPQKVVAATSVKIIGLGGAGTNMLERVALDGMDGAELLALNTDTRTLGSCMAPEKIQLGANLTKGLGSGGDPDLGHQAVLEAEQALREALKDRRIVFLCVGLGGGTGSGAAPIVTRIAREEGAFVVVFATMPFAFEGRRRREQAETALNELAVLSNALVTFDNNRMGELVLAKQGIHEAFTAADHMIREAIKAVLRLVIRPGLINVGLDDLMSALRTTRSRCLFGSGIASGKDRAAKALRAALASPLLDQGSLLKDAQTVIVHLCGGEDLTLFEVELLMQNLGKHVPEKAHVLFGAAVDPAIGDALSITLISALPEDTLAMARRDSISRASDDDNPLLDSPQGFTPAAATTVPVAEKEPEPETPPAEPAEPPVSPAKSTAAAVTPALFDEEMPFTETIPAPEPAETAAEHVADAEPAPAEPAPLAKPSVMVAEFVAVPQEDEEEFEKIPAAKPAETLVADDSANEPWSEADTSHEEPELEAAGFSSEPPTRPQAAAPWSSSSGPKTSEPAPAKASKSMEHEIDAPKLKLGIKTASTQSELSLDAAPRGRFEGESPNVYDGEDLDLPPFLRKKK